ncbi:MAG: glycosyl transferase family 2 [Gemmatimonadetes bacterium]|nr:glycosyl transferase family 2 [Gemmatimonadota bacterium]
MVTSWFQTGLLLIYSLALGLLLLFSLHRHVLVRLYFKNKGLPRTPKGSFSRLPKVTIQLPVYNEFYVVERLIRSVAEIDYPPSLLEIQVLDDSTDETSDLAKRVVAELMGKGLDIVYIHREKREGFKAGAMGEGLKVAKGEFVAVFDADFLAPGDFLNNTIHHFTDDRVGMIQARWGHLNRDYSLLTKVQSIFLDGHFVIEHGARSRASLFFNFNGTAGIWRKSCIEDSGGWQHDTLTEDLDLSYRAQMGGWRFVFLDDVVSPAEVPVEMNAWKNQQFRWSKGSVQTARKLLMKVVRSNLRPRVKVEAVIALTANFAYLLMALVALLIFPAVLSRLDLGWYRVFVVDLPLFFAATGAVSRFYIYSQKEVYADWKTRIKYIPCVLAVGMGISFNNACAVVEALGGRESEFRRTPKYHVVNQGDSWQAKRYGVSNNFLPFLEVTIGAYFCWVISFSIRSGVYFPVPFLVLFCSGFFYVGLMSLFQGRWERLRLASTKVETAPAD